MTILPFWAQFSLLAVLFVWLLTSSVYMALRIARMRQGSSSEHRPLSTDELRAMILENDQLIPAKHQGMLRNLIELERISVDDIMVSRAHIEALDFKAPMDEIIRQLTTCYHTKLPVYEGEINHIIGILHARKALVLLNQDQELTLEHFRDLLTPAYFVPEDTNVLMQLRYFQERRERLGLIVDEYGEVQGLVTLDDIVEEIIGEFTTSTPGEAKADTFHWDQEDLCILEGTTHLRDINKRLALTLPTDGPKTLNGLLLELLQDIPDAPVCVKIDGCAIEILQVQNQAIKTVRMTKFPH